MACFAGRAPTSGFQQFVPVFFAHRIVESQIHFYEEVAALLGACKFDKLI